MTPTIEQVAAIAWDLVKSDDDPMFSACHREHQDKLTYHARDVQKTGITGDDFERKVAEVLASPGAAIEAIKAKFAPPVDPANGPPFTSEPEPDAPPTNPLPKLKAAKAAPEPVEEKSAKTKRGK
jgi:hypothetical protein